MGEFLNPEWLEPADGEPVRALVALRPGAVVYIGGMHLLSPEGPQVTVMCSRCRERPIAACDAVNAQFIRGFCCECRPGEDCAEGSF